MIIAFSLNACLVLFVLHCCYSEAIPSTKMNECIYCTFTHACMHYAFAFLSANKVHQLDTIQYRLFRWSTFTSTPLEISTKTIQDNKKMHHPFWISKYSILFSPHTDTQQQQENISSLLSSSCLHALHSTTFRCIHNNKNGNIFLHFSTLHWLTSTSRFVVIFISSLLFHPLSIILSPLAFSLAYKYLHTFCLYTWVYISSKIVRERREITNVNEGKMEEKWNFFVSLFSSSLLVISRRMLCWRRYELCVHIYFFLFSSPWQICIKGRRRKKKKKKLVGLASKPYMCGGKPMWCSIVFVFLLLPKSLQKLS